jgi:hypothetical protein
VGNGLTVDFGKWASSLGIEINFTQTKSTTPARIGSISCRSHQSLHLNQWVTNGTQQTEPFNDFKDQFGGLTIQPNKNLSWNLNYDFGQEHPDVVLLREFHRSQPAHAARRALPARAERQAAYLR